jgi:hypothetical protein
MTVKVNKFKTIALTYETQSSIKTVFELGLYIYFLTLTYQIKVKKLKSLPKLKTYRRRLYRAALINFGASWKWMVDLVPWSLSFPVHTVPRFRSVCFKEKKTLLLLPGIEPRIVHPVTYYTHNLTPAPPNIPAVICHTTGSRYLFCKVCNFKIIVSQS